MNRKKLAKFYLLAYGLIFIFTPLESSWAQSKKKGAASAAAAKGPRASIDPIKAVLQSFALDKELSSQQETVLAKEESLSTSEIVNFISEHFNTGFAESKSKTCSGASTKSGRKTKGAAPFVSTAELEFMYIDSWTSDQEEMMKVVAEQLMECFPAERTEMLAHRKVGRSKDEESYSKSVFPHTYIVKWRGEISGHLSVLPSVTRHGRTVNWIFNVCVPAAKRGQGLVGRLLEHTMASDLFKEIPAALEVHSINLPALKAYARIGLKVINAYGSDASKGKKGTFIMMQE